MNPIIERIEKADLIIIATPVFVMSCSSGLKALLDHLAYIWLVHRPKESMFKKVGFIITSAGGSGVRYTGPCGVFCRLVLKMRHDGGHGGSGCR